MSYLLIHKDPLVIFHELSIPVPMSHPIKDKADAMRWMTERGMQSYCKVIPESQFRALTGLLPKG